VEGLHVILKCKFKGYILMCMYRKYMCSVFVLLLGMVGSASADTNWNNNGGDRDWDNSSNWSAGVPTSAVYFRLRRQR